MAATITSLTASPSSDGINLGVEFTDPHVPGGLPYLQTDLIEYWASQTNNRATATKVTQGFDAAKHAGLAAGDTWYYWARAREANGVNFGDFYPVSTTAGVAATVFADSDAWVPFSPTVASTVGTIAAYTVNAVYKLIGNVCHVQVYINITNNGTGSNGMYCTLPFAANVGPSSTRRHLGIMINESNGDMGRVAVVPSATEAHFRFYDGGHAYDTVLGGSQHLDLDFQYEIN